MEHTLEGFEGLQLQELPELVQLGYVEIEDQGIPLLAGTFVSKLTVQTPQMFRAAWIPRTSTSLMKSGFPGGQSVRVSLKCPRHDSPTLPLTSSSESTCGLLGGSLQDPGDILVLVGPGTIGTSPLESRDAPLLPVASHFRLDLGNPLVKVSRGQLLSSSFRQ